MATTKPAATDFHTEETYDGNELDGEWLKPVESMTVRGTLERAFLVENEEGKLQPAYGIRDDEGAMWLIGERASFKKAMRTQRMGTNVILTFIEKVPMMKDGKKTSKNFWRTSLESKRDGKGDSVQDVLIRDFKSRGEALPF